MDQSSIDVENQTINGLIENTQNSQQLLTQNNQQPDEIKESFDYVKYDQLVSGQTRWILPSKKTLLLVVKYFTKVTGQFDTKLEFENFFYNKMQSISVNG